MVNNAGIFSVYGPDDWCTIEEYRRSIDVNLLGVIRVTHAFKSLVKKSKGRIITVSSVAGRITAPGTAPYSVAKYGAESYMDAIRYEYDSLHVHHFSFAKLSLDKSCLFCTAKSDAVRHAAIN